MIRFVSRRVSSVLLCFFAMIGAAWANCGLENCPMHYAEHSKFLLHAMLRQTSFDIEEVQGNYGQLHLSLQYTGLKNFSLGVSGSFVRLDDGEETVSGLGNPMLFAEWRPIHEEHRIVSLGAQLELNAGDRADGIAADHNMLLPYVGLRQTLGGFHVAANVGARLALGSEHVDEEEMKQVHPTHEGEHPMFVNPHEDHELLYRLGVGRELGASKIEPQLFLDAQHVLDGEAKGDAFVSVGLNVDVPLGDQYTLTPAFEAPISSNKRFEWRASVGMTAKL